MTAVHLPAVLAAREHLAWCVTRGMTATEVCESVGAFLTAPTWSDAQTVLERRWTEMQEDRPCHWISDRRAAA